MAAWLFLFSATTAAQSNYRIEKFDSQNGLRHHWVTSVQQDSFGFIWVTLKDGLMARFDGHSFKHFPMSEAEKKLIGGDALLRFRIDSQQRFLLWVDRTIAPNSPANARFDPVSGRFFKEENKIGQAKAAMPNQRVSESGQGATLRLLDDPTRIERTLSDGTKEVFPFTEKIGVYDLLDTGNEIWVAAFEGLFKITPRRRLFETLLSKPFDLQKGPATGYTVYGITESNGWLWFIGNRALVRTPLASPGKAEVLYDSETMRGSFELMADSRGWLWPGQFVHNPRIYRASAPFDFSEFAHEMSESRSFLELPDGRVWVATRHSVIEVAPGTPAQRPILPDTLWNAWDFYLDKNMGIWAATEQGLYHLVPKENSKEYALAAHYHSGNTPGLTTSKFLSINEKDGYLWLGSDGGLIRFRIEDGSRSAIPNFKSEIARAFTTADGLPHNKVYFALPEGGFLWCATEMGLARVTLASVVAPNDSPTTAAKEQAAQQVPEIRNFHIDDGLPHEEFNTLSFHKSPTTGKIYLGGLNGMTIFSPKDLEKLPVSDHQLVLTEVEKYDAKHDTTILLNLVGASNPLVFEHYDQSVNFRFSLLSYANPAFHRYLYRMEGFEKHWNEAGNVNSARYAALPPGRYTFRVRAADHNGNWSRQEIALSILVKRAWYATWWAWTFYLMAAGGLVFFFYKQRLREVRLAAKAQHLEELDAFKSRFFTNITHEFRTPLTVILGNLEIMKLEIGKQVAQSPLSQFLISKISMTRRNAESLLRLINQILDLAKLEDKSLKMNYVKGDVLPYLRYIAESLHSYANAQNVMVRVESPEPQIVMDYDPERLLSIVYNLLSNAVKFTPSGGRVVLWLETWEDYLSKEWLILEVSDTGTGIPSADLPRIFNHFYQAENQEHTKAGGTGIGLSLTKELVKAMGGEIGVESEVGKGTTFTVRLPIVRSTMTPKGETYPSSSAILTKVKTANELPDFGSQAQSNEGNPSNLQSFNPSILLVDDNPDVVEYLASCLTSPPTPLLRGEGGDHSPLLAGEGSGVRLVFAYNGRAGIEKALETVPDLIISDVMMPEKDGFEVCETLKNDERTSHVPIILLTAKADVESRIAGLKRGADAYLAKPFNQEELLVTVANLLEIRRKLRYHYRQSAGLVPTPRDGSPQLPAPVIPHSSSLIPDPEDVFLQKLRTAIEPRLGDADLNAEEICRQIGMSRSVLYAKLSALTGLSFNLYLRSLRLRKAQDLLLRHAEMNVSEVAYEVGFNDPRYFMRVFSEEFGLPPGEWRKQA